MKGNISIDGKNFSYTEGETILDVALKNGIDIPVLCYLKDIAETGSCRVCLVEVEGLPVPVASCATFAADGMSVKTDTDEVRKHRLKALEFILLKHPLECGFCENSGDCQLQSLAGSLGVSEVKPSGDVPKRKPIDWKMLLYDGGSCVLCQRCAKICSDVTGCNALEIASRGNDTHMAAVMEGGDDCDYCGICVDVCPVGAIMDKPFKYSVKVWKLSNVHTACSFCPVGCRVNYGVYGGAIHRVRRSGDGYTCSKGRYGFKFIESGKRLKVPVIKRSGHFAPASWGEAVGAVYNAIVKYGPENSLIVAGSRLTNEELYNFRSLADKTGMRFITEAEVYFGPFMRSYKEKFGHYQSVGFVKDLENCDLIFVIGADFARECVGIKWSVLKAAAKKGAKIITVGLQRYEYDERTYASIIADFADFAGEFEKIKNDGAHIYSSIRNYITDAVSVGIVIGNEYFAGEEQQESVLAFADYIGAGKLKVFIAANDKVNYVGALKAGGETVEDLKAAAPKVVFAMAVNPGKGKLEALKQAIDGAEFYATPDLFITGTVRNADVVMPVKASLEGDGTYTSLDGKLNRMEKVVEPPAGAKSNSEIAESLALLFRKKVDADHGTVFFKHSKEFGFKPEDWNSDEQPRLKEKRDFNPTFYKYEEKDRKPRVVYVNARHHEGVLTRILESEPEDMEFPLFPNVEVVIKPGASRSEVDYENIAKGVILVPRGKI